MIYLIFSRGEKMSEKLDKLMQLKGAIAAGEYTPDGKLLRGNPRKTRERIKPSITREKEINK